MIIGCLRPTAVCYSDNLNTLDYLNRIDVLSDPEALPATAPTTAACMC